MLAVLLVAAVSAAAIATALHRRRSVLRVAPGKTRPFVTAVRRGDAGSLEIEARPFFTDAEERGLLVGALAQGTASPQVVAIVNERLGEVARELDVGRAAPRSFARVTLAAGALAAVLEVSKGIEGDALAIRNGVLEFVAGLVVAVLVFEMDRGTEATVREARARWDEVGTAVSGRLGLDAAEHNSSTSEPTRSRKRRVHPR